MWGIGRIYVVLLQAFLGPVASQIRLGVHYWQLSIGMTLGRGVNV